MILKGKVPKPDLEQIILPARHLELVFAEFEEEDRLDIRGTIIYNVYQEEGYFLVAQTGPPVLRSMVEARVEATFLWQPTPADEPSRYAFNTTIQDLVTKYFYPKGMRSRLFACLIPDTCMNVTSVFLIV